MRFRSLTVLAFLTLVACSDDSAGPTAKEVFEAIPDLTRMTPKAVQVNPELMTLCVGVWKSHVEEAEKTHGPHAHAAIVVSMNDLAKAAFEEGRAYPAGAVIVKEKHRHGFMEQADDETARDVEREDGTGGMIKRAEGTSPDSGDWEFFYSSVRGGLETGQITSCVVCHENAKDRDWVFGTWRAPSAPRG